MELFEAVSAAKAVLTRDEEHLIPVYARYPVVMERGEGCTLYDVDGNRYLDMMGGLGVNALGHAHPRMVQTMVDQATRWCICRRSTPTPGRVCWRKSCVSCPNGGRFLFHRR